MVQSGVPKDFWAEAIATPTFIRNRCPSSAINNQIPAELWTGKKMLNEEIDKMKVFGCKAWTKRLFINQIDLFTEHI